jgi:hypothetical protein
MCECDEFFGGVLGDANVVDSREFKRCEMLIKLKRNGGSCAIDVLWVFNARLTSIALQRGSQRYFRGPLEKVKT